MHFGVVKFSMHGRALAILRASSHPRNRRTTMNQSIASEETFISGLADRESRQKGGLSSPPTLRPTLPERRKGVTDGNWDTADVAAVDEALNDAKKIVRQKEKLGCGQVILGEPLDKLQQLVTSHGQQAYRGKQLLDAVLTNGIKSVEDIQNVPKALRTELISAGVRTGRSVLQHTVTSSDGTRKFLLQLFDGRVIETVGIPADSDYGATRKRLTVCVSSQVGCPMRCTFCATGKGGFARNLMPHEIVDQVLTVQEEFGERCTNVVYMGMGEPLLNLPSVVQSYHILNSQVGIGSRNITISTVGVPNAIRALAAHQLQITLAVSIHAPTQELRQSIIPSAAAYPLDALMSDCAYYFQKTGRRVSFEYTLLAGVNDSPEHAQALSTLLRRYDLRSHVNVIPWNPVDDSEHRRPSKRSVSLFLKALEGCKVACSLRNTRGLEAAAACGQLRNKFQKDPMVEFTLPR